MTILWEVDPPFLAELDHENITQYRKDYRQYRLGCPKGSSGEVGQLLQAEEDDSCHHVEIEVEEGEEEDINEKGAAPVKCCDWSTEAVRDYENGTSVTELFRIITAWRLQYRKFRRGCAHGAEGDVGMLAKCLDRRHLSLLPVCQLREVHSSSSKASISQQQSKFHVHFGAGKLGLGLVVTLLENAKVPFAIVQPPNEEWDPMLDNPVVTINVNGRFITNCLIVPPSAAELPAGFPAFPPSVNNKQTCWFICSNSSSIMSAVSRSADSFSCAVGGDINLRIGPLLNFLPLRPPSSRPVLYACENDHSGVEKLQVSLLGRVAVRPCMVDRICSDRLISAKEIEVITEPYEGELVVLPCEDQTMECPQPPFAGPGVHVPQLTSQANYLSQRKFLLVNGLHTTLAFMTLCAKNSTGPLGDYELITTKTATPEERREMWVWAAARCLLLLWEHDSNVIMTAHGISTDVELVSCVLEYAKTTLGRFASVTDTTGRVLSGGIANRYQGRLKMVQEFMDTQNAGSIPLALLLLKEADVGFCELGYTIHSLVTRSRRFVQMPLIKQASMPMKQASMTIKAKAGTEGGDNKAAASNGSGAAAGPATTTVDDAATTDDSATFEGGQQSPGVFGNSRPVAVAGISNPLRTGRMSRPGLEAFASFEKQKN
eukprot:GHVS01103277.1.p1 GENE.GHVS01103277.1~~GHVS01103277.1.p1  ORF type:complete len:658 (+),score=115.58 GHVS01103277.1:149-2122(+)